MILFALVIGTITTESIRADPVDPRIVVRGSTTGGTYHIYDLGTFEITLDSSTINSYGGIFWTGSQSDAPEDNLFFIVFRNDTNQTIRRLVIQFAISDFTDTNHPDPYLPADQLVFEGEGQYGFDFLGSPDAVVDLVNGTVTWTFTGFVPPGDTCGGGYFDVRFESFPQGMTGRFTVSAPETVTLGLLAIGLALLGLVVRTFRV